MAGLLNGGMPPAPSRPQQGQPQQSQGQRPQGGGNDEGNQEMYDIAAGQILNFVYSEEGHQGISEALRNGNPQEQMARWVGRLLTTAAQSASLSGKRIPPKILFQAGMEVAGALSEIAQKLGALPQEQEKEITENAFYDGIAAFAQEASEEALTPQDRQAYVDLLNQLEQMEAGARPAQPAQAPMGG